MRRAVDYIMSRLSFISEQDGTVDAAYQYLGLDTIAVEDYPQAGIELAYTFDRFGRVEYQAWEPDSGSGRSSIKSLMCGRPRRQRDFGPLEETAGNCTQSPGMDSVWTQDLFDGLGRVSSYTQQLYAATGDRRARRDENWLYDSLGNNIQQSTGGSYNADNEETTIKGGSVVPGYDLAGNMQTLSNGDTAVYDAWGRLVEVDGTSGIVEQCEYDGTGRRVQISTSSPAQRRHGRDRLLQRPAGDRERHGRDRRRHDPLPVRLVAALHRRPGLPRHAQRRRDRQPERSHVLPRRRQLQRHGGGPV